MLQLKVELNEDEHIWTTSTENLGIACTRTQVLCAAVSPRGVSLSELQAKRKPSCDSASHLPQPPSLSPVAVRTDLIRVV